jgi:hypothetical protein
MSRLISLISQEKNLNNGQIIGEALIELKIVTEKIGELMIQQVKTDEIE